MIQQTRTFKKRVAITLVLTMLFEIIYPTTVLALTEGPKQPEFEKFTPVATTNMVNALTGDFQYNLPVLNIPGADGGGYALSLSYNASPAMDAEASWVGQNWTLNPGALTRNKQGVPDDYKGKIKEYNLIKPHFSFSRTDGASVSVGFGEANSIGVSFNTTHTWNNYTGYGDSKYIGLSTNIPIDLSMGVTFGGRDATFSVNVTIGAKLEGLVEAATDNIKDTKENSSWKKMLNKQLGSEGQKQTISSSGQFGIFGAVNSSVAATVKPHRSMGYTFGGTAQALLGPVTASYNRVQNTRLQVNQPIVRYNAYGYMYNPNQSTHVTHYQNSNDDDRHIMSDYGIEKNSNYSVRDNIIGVVHNNADLFNAVGEGISGSYRLHHNKVGHYYSDWAAEGASRNVSVVPNLTGGAGFALSEGTPGAAFKFGLNFQFENRTKTKAKQWLAWDNQWGLTPDVSARQFDDPNSNNNLPKFRAKNDIGGSILFVNPDKLDETVREYRGGFFGLIKKGDGTLDGNLLSFDRPNVSDFIESNQYQGRDYYKGGSTNMEYVLNQDLHNSTSPSSGLQAINNTNAFDKSNSTLKFLDSETWSNTEPVIANGSVENSDLEEHVAQIRVTNPDGLKYTYGLPVYVRDEANFTYGVDVSGENRYGCGNQRDIVLDNNNIVYPMVQEGYAGDAERNLKIKQGQILEEWYAGTYLMTQITTPDYVDIENDGVTEDDFGGFTKFDYRRWVKNYNHSGDEMNNWYRFRAPYTGLKYNPLEHAKKHDDLGSVSHGYREMYYLKAIETKSHIAFFITNKTDADADLAEYGITGTKLDGSGVERLDGLGQVQETTGTDPLGNPVNRADVPGYGCLAQNYTHNRHALNSKNAKDLFQDVEKLEKIVLFAKSDMDNPLVTTRFEYDYSAWQNIPNNSKTNLCSSGGNSNNKGKLTLKKVWFEYEGVRKHKVSPYEFEYEYGKVNGPDKSFSDVVMSRYPAIFNATNEGHWPTAGTNALEEKPNYNQHAVNRWGYIGYDGAQRRENYETWLYQGAYDASKGYDPAAWMLKQIKLPSGGEIHIQYEEKTYQKVQDKDAMAMVSLKPDLSYDDAPGSDMNRFYLNLEDMGIENTLEKKKELIELIKKNYMADNELDQAVVLPDYTYKLKTSPGKKDNRVYFKFKYELEEGSDEEYISGYAVVRAIGLDNNEVFLSIGNALEKTKFKNRKDVPRQLCYDHVVANNFGSYGYDYLTAGYHSIVTTEASSHSQYNDFKAEVDGGGNPVNTYGNHVDDVGIDHMDQNFVARDYPTYKSGSLCKSINYGHSYIRVPMVTPKRGGGLRVKRVLMYDEGLENGDEQLFGMEYDYVNADGTCSGVATNEPNEGREENALVDYEKRKDINPLVKIFAGDDRKEGETPYGEFLLPPPSVNYSRVVVSNIYKGTQQNDGFKVTEYYTHKDYPTSMKFDDEKFGILNGLSSVQHTALGSGFPSLEDVRLNYRLESLLPVSVSAGPASFNYNRHYRWMAQAFMFIQTNMSGKVKSEQTYGGVYNRDYFANPDPAVEYGISKTSEVTYDYVQPGEQVKVLRYNNVSNEYELEDMFLGVEDDVTMSAQAVYEESFNSGMDLSFMITYFGSFSVTPNFGLNFSFGERGMARHMTTRVLHFPSVLKSVTTEMNNSVSTVEHLAYSDLTGTPILTKSTDGYDRNIVVDAGGNRVVHDGAIYNWNLPAAWFYEPMGKSSINPSYTNQLNASVGSVTSYGKDGNPIKSNINNWVANPTGVLSASAVTLKDGNWFAPLDPIISEYAPNATNISALATELNQLYRVHKTYVYDPTATASSANDNVTDDWGEGGQKVYYSGIYDNFNMFDWSTGIGTGWKAVTQVDKYSPNGYSLQEIDLITEIPSAAKYGYRKFLSKAIAQNANYNSIGFESFEDEKFADSQTPHANLITGEGHAGKNSFEIGTTAETIIDNIIIDSRITNQNEGNGFMVRLWAKNELIGSTNKVNFGGYPHIEIALKDASNTYNTTSQERVIAQVGEWVLLEYLFDYSSLTVSANTLELQFKVTGTQADGTALSSLIIDDVRIQPVNAEMKTYVYDNKSFKLLATFGSEHFGAFYQYNDEGDLTRTLIETERGMKTIQENQGNTPQSHQPSN